MPEKNLIEGSAIVELMGHNVIAGAVSEVTIAGVAFLRVDVPEVDGSPAFTKFFGGSAIYAITPTDEATARQAAARLAVRPVNVWVVPDGRRKLPAPTIDEDSGGPDEWDDVHPEDWDDREIERT